MSDPFIGQLMAVGFNFAPPGWALCQGQLLSIAQNTALFSLLGTTYGGDGETTFGLPDLRGRYAMGAGNGPGLSPRTLGQRSGAESVTLTVGQLPAHTHALTPQCASGGGDDTNPAGNYPANTGGIGDVYSSTQNASMGQSTTANAGSNQAHNNMPPFVVINWAIALTGIYPSRS